jgi:ribosomal protein S27E
MMGREGTPADQARWQQRFREFARPGWFDRYRPPGFREAFLAGRAAAAPHLIPEAKVDQAGNLRCPNCGTDQLCESYGFGDAECGQCGQLMNDPAPRKEPLAER